MITIKKVTCYSHSSQEEGVCQFGAYRGEPHRDESGSVKGRGGEGGHGHDSIVVSEGRNGKSMGGLRIG